MDAPLSWTSAPPRLDAQPAHAPARHAATRQTPARHALPDMVVRRSPTGFVVCCPLLEALVGAPALPLPYAPEATPDEVVAVLQRNNPTRLVRFDPTPLDGAAHRDRTSHPVPRTPR